MDERRPAERAVVGGRGLLVRCGYAGRTPSVTLTVFVLPFRVTLTLTTSDGLWAATAAVSASPFSIVVPSIEVITPPAFSPALSPGEQLTTMTISAPPP